MPHMRSSHNARRLSAMVLAGLFSVGTAIAQTPDSPPAQSSPVTPTPPPVQSSPGTPPAQAAAPSMLTEIENWTEQQWDAAKAKWMSENAKWTECERQVTDQKLTGRQSWVFLYRCMF